MRARFVTASPWYVVSCIDRDGPKTLTHHNLDEVSGIYPPLTDPQRCCTNFTVSSTGRDRVRLPLRT